MIIHDDYDTVLGALKRDSVHHVEFFSTESYKPKDVLSKKTLSNVVAIHKTAKEWHVCIVFGLESFLNIDTNEVVVACNSTTLRYKTKKAAMAALKSLDEILS